MESNAQRLSQILCNYHISSTGNAGKRHTCYAMDSIETQYPTTQHKNTIQLGT